MEKQEGPKPEIDDIREDIMDQLNKIINSFPLDSQRIYAPEALTKTKFKNSLENGTVSIELIYSSSKYYGVDVEELFLRRFEDAKIFEIVNGRLVQGLEYSTIDDEKLKIGSFIKNALRFAFGNDSNRYAINEKDMGLLFPDSEMSFTLSCMHLPLKSEVCGSRHATKAVEKLNLMLSKESNGVCRVQGATEDTNGRKGVLEGFAVVLSPNTKHPSCWIMLRRVDDGFTSLLILCFNLNHHFKQNEFGVQIDHDSHDGFMTGDTRVAEVIDLRAVDSMPFQYKAIVCKNDDGFDERHFSSLAGYLRLNTEQVYITCEALKITESFLSKMAELDVAEEDMVDICKVDESIRNSVYFDGLKSCFDGLLKREFRQAYDDFQKIQKPLIGSDKNHDCESSSGSVHVIDYNMQGLGTAATVRDLFKQNRSLSAWLSKNDLHPANSRLTPHHDIEVERMYLWVKELEERKQKSQ